jgi:TIR domain
MDSSKPKLIEIFYSYASTEDGIDEKLQQQLEKHLGILKRQGKISNWHKRNIMAGQNALQETAKHLNSAQIVLLLISPDFIDSDECWDLEMQQALERQKEEKTLVVPVLLRPVDYKAAPFTHLQVLPKNGKPITSWSNQDEAFEDIARHIRLLAEQFENTQRISWKNLGVGITFATAISTLLTSDNLTTPTGMPSGVYIGTMDSTDLNLARKFILYLYIKGAEIQGKWIRMEGVDPHRYPPYAALVNPPKVSRRYENSINPEFSSRIESDRSVSFTIAPYPGGIRDIYYFSGRIALDGKAIEGEYYKKYGSGEPRRLTSYSEKARWQVSYQDNT